MVHMQVLIWNIQDHDNGSLLKPKPKDTVTQPVPGTRMGARSVLTVRGHMAPCRVTLAAQGACLHRGC